MSDDTTAEGDEATDRDRGSTPSGPRSRTRRHLVVLLIAVLGLLVGGGLVLSGRSSSTDRTATTAPTTTAAPSDALLPSLGVVPDLAAAKDLLERLDPRTLRPDPTSDTTTGAGVRPTTTVDRTVTTAPTTTSAEPAMEATEAGARRCQTPIQQQTTDRSLGDRLASARLQVGSTTDLVLSYALPASGENPASTRVLLVDARSCRVLAAVQH